MGGHIVLQRVKSAQMVAIGVSLGFTQTHPGLRAPGPAPGPVLDLALVCPLRDQTKQRLDSADE
jgi:hypothetical protein